MKVIERPSLAALNTFGISASAGLLMEIETEEDVLSVPSFDPDRDFILGGGSNILFLSDVPGVVYLNRIRGMKILDETSEYVLAEAGAGENWHRLVRWTLARGLCGLENLSLIPGLTGAAPIQNIGAYGVELSSVLQSVTAWDWKQAAWITFSEEECLFAYRDSRFKSMEPDRYLITSIQLRLARIFSPKIAYKGIIEELSEHSITEPTATDVSEAVIRLRQRKLPDTAKIGNAGSFFKNPVTDRDEADALLLSHPGLPAWPDQDNRIKLSAAWMIEHCGLKGMRDGDAGVSGMHALVLVNHGSARGSDIAALAHKVRTTVFEEFGIMLESEPRLVDFG